MARRKTNIANQGPVVEDEASLGSLINRELKQSLTYDQSQLATKRAITLEYVRGIMPDLPGRPNGSQQTSRDISDVMSWMLPGIMRTMTASDQMVRYSPTDEGQDEWAEQATAFANWSFFRDNAGYRNLYNATYDSLAMGNGVAICYYDEEITRDQTLTGQTLEDIADLTREQKEPVKILSQRPGATKKVTDDYGAETEQPTFDIKIRRTIRKGKICHETGKTENLLINAAATTLDDARFVSYLHDDWTRSDLLEMGFDKSVVESLAPGPNFARNQVELARRYELTTNWQSPVRSGDRIDTYECYVKYDADGDGIAELLQVWYAGTIGAGVVLGWDYWEDDLPFTDIPCYPIPHRWDAESVADRTVDIQRVKTVLLRAGLDSTYASVLPQRTVQQGAILNPDALNGPRWGNTIWVKKGVDAQAAIGQAQIPYTADMAFSAMQQMDEVITKRTGVSRTTMALDPDALTNQTATAAQNLRDAGYSQVELVARNMAELGWSDYFAKFLRMAVKYGIVAKIPVQKNGKTTFQAINAGEWNDGMAVSINTGLGTGSRDRDMAMLNVMLGTQINMATQLKETGVPALQMKALEFIPKILETAKLQAESAGIKDPSAHYIEISPQELQQAAQQMMEASQQGNPEQAIANLKLQGQQQKNQSDALIAQLESRSAQIRAAAEEQSSIADIRMKQLEQQGEIRQQQLEGIINDLEIKLKAATADADNATKLKSQALNNLTQIIVAGLNNKQALDTTMVEGWLERVIGIQQHAQNIELATHNANLQASLQASAPPPNGAAN